MRELPDLVPDVDHLLLLEPEELGAKMLFGLRARGNRRRDLPASASQFVIHNLLNEIGGGYPAERLDEVRQAMVEAWGWLEAQGLLVMSPRSGGDYGWRVLSRRAKRFEDEAEFTKFAVARRLPREMLHPRIAQPVWSAFMRGEFDIAVFQAVKAVEIAVRDASGIDKVGVALVRDAFHPETGPLSDLEVDRGERQARADLFAGAIGSFKNPQSHRDVDLSDPEEAIEIILLANHLLRIVEARAPTLDAR